MFASLRTRLWLSYALLIFTALCLAAVVLLLYLVRNPLSYRDAVTRLRTAGEQLAPHLPELDRAAPQALLPLLVQLDARLDVRVLLYDADLSLLADSRAGRAAPLPLPRLSLVDDTPVRTRRDVEGQAWLYSVRRLPSGRALMLATPRPRVPFLTILRDEFLPSFSQAGLVALLLSLLLAYLMARWVADPLQSVIAAARAFPQGGEAPLALRGPREVQDLVRAFNQMTARVQASQRSQRDFVANVSHELKTPLTSIQGFAQALLDGAADTPDARRQAAQVIHTEAGRMHRMVLDLLDLARLDSGTADFKMTALDLPALLRGVAEKMEPQARQAGVRLLVEAPELPALFGDGDRLSQVFTNLVDNALKFTPPGGEVRLRAALEGAGRVAVSVQDTGTGIPPEVVPHVFDRFFQGDPARAGGNRHGAGLGLSIAREIVHAHHGEIAVSSQPGQGSTFTVRLPLVQPDATTVLGRRG